MSGSNESIEKLDVDLVIVGAGIAGISAYYHLLKSIPKLSINIIESKDSLGGTWDTFRYPGLRCDSDMYSYAFSFAPYKGDEALASGEDIKSYIKDVANELDIPKHTHFNTKLDYASWCSTGKYWSLFVSHVMTGEKRTIRSRFLFSCSGYFSHEQAHVPYFKDQECYQGQRLVPQHWPDNYDFKNRNIALVGSGATAISMLPALAKSASSVTLIQRSPSYVFSQKGLGFLKEVLYRLVSKDTVHKIEKFYYTSALKYSIWSARTFPRLSKLWWIQHMRSQIKPEKRNDIDLVPNYAPWEQRLCVTPDGEYFKALNQDNVTSLHDQIDRFLPEGIKLTSGKRLKVDAVVMATGLQLKILGGVHFAIDGASNDISIQSVYKGSMLTNMPNFFFSTGYRKAAWTQKTELVARYASRVLSYMIENGHMAFSVKPEHKKGIKFSRLPDDFKPNYILRHESDFPLSGDTAPWQINESPKLDEMQMLRERVKDDYLSFS